MAAQTMSPESSGYEGGAPVRLAMTRRPRTEPLWRKHEAMSMKSGSRSTIFWVGKSILGEGGLKTGAHAKGASYHGDWARDKKDGYGVQVFPNGEKYEGQWGSGLRNGEGTLWVPAGKAQKLRKLYVGGWKNGKRHGRGTCYFQQGESFQGSWENGKMQGHGTLRYSNGDLYIGEWHEGLRSGKGTLSKANGDCYEGYWLKDKREGSGSHFYADSGKVFVGEWANDLPKAGVYTQANPNPEQAAQVPVTSTLPGVRLASPALVLEEALANVRSERRGFRAASAPIERLFAEDEVTALRNAFSGFAKSGMVRARELQELCAQLGSDVPVSKLKELALAAGLVAPGTRIEAADSIAVKFEDFLRIIALLLDEDPADSDLEGSDSWATPEATAAAADMGGEASGAL